MQTQETITDFTKPIHCSYDMCKKPVYCKGLCKNHYTKPFVKRYRSKNPQKAMQQYYANHEDELAKRQARRDADKNKQREYRRKIKDDVFSYYANGTPVCAMCGYTDMRALCLDHINGGGREHREQLAPKGRCGSTHMYVWLRKRGYPAGFQVLCENCNRIKEHERLRAAEFEVNTECH